jgi:hypothetical protein
MALTTNEQQELDYLEVFVFNKITKFSSMSFPPVVTAAMGSGASTIVINFIRDGVVADLYTGEYEFTEVGHKRYNILRRKKMADKFANLAFWIIFGCTVVTLGDVVYKWFTKPPSIPETTKSAAPATLQKTGNPPQTIVHDSIKGHHTDSSKKSDSTKH